MDAIMVSTIDGIATEATISDTGGGGWASGFIRCISRFLFLPRAKGPMLLDEADADEVVLGIERE